MNSLFPPALFQFDIIDTVYFISGLVILTLGLIVSFRERGTSVGRTYFLFTLSIAAWVISSGMLMAAQNERIANLLVPFVNIPVAYIPATIFHYTRVLLRDHRNQMFQIQLIWFISSVFALLQIADLDFASAYAFEFGYYSLYGNSGYLFIVYFSLTISWTYYSFIRNSLRMEHNAESRQRFRWITIALVASLFATLDFMPAIGIDIQPYGVLFILILFIITTFVTWRYRLVDITVEFVAQNLLHIIPNPLMIFDLYGEIRLCNNVAKNKFGPEQRQAIKNILLPQIQQQPTTFITKKKNITINVTLEIDGDIHTYETTISPIYSQQNSILAYNCLFTDISDIIYYQRSLKDAHDELESRVEARTVELKGEIDSHKKTVVMLEATRQEAIEASQAKSVFLSRMSHELRTPMNAILGFSQVLQLDSSAITADDQKKYIHHIHEAGTHLLALIEDILDLSRIQLDRLGLQAETINLTEILSACIRLVEQMAQAKGISVSIDEKSCSGLQIFADPTRLKQVVINLLNNAIKYNKENGKVLIQCQQLDGYTRISVQDSGIGIANNVSEKVFMPFERLSNVLTNSDGVGIGLSLCKQLVEMQGGQIGYESTEGLGSTFWFELPVSK